MSHHADGEEGVIKEGDKDYIDSNLCNYATLTGRVKMQSNTSAVH